MSNPFSIFKLPTASQKQQKSQGLQRPPSSSRPVFGVGGFSVRSVVGAAGNQVGSGSQRTRSASPTRHDVDGSVHAETARESRVASFADVRTTFRIREFGAVTDSVGGGTASRRITTIAFERRTAPGREQGDRSNTSNILEFGPAELLSLDNVTSNRDGYAVVPIIDDVSDPYVDPFPDDRLQYADESWIPEPEIGLNNTVPFPSNGRPQTPSKRPPFCLSRTKRAPTSSPSGALSSPATPNTWLRSVVLPPSSPCAAAGAPERALAVRRDSGPGPLSDMLRTTLGRKRSEEVLWHYRGAGNVDGNAFTPDMSAKVIQAKRAMGMMITKCVFVSQPGGMRSHTASTDLEAPVTICLASYVLDGPGEAADVAALESLGDDCGGDDVLFVELFAPLKAVESTLNTFICTRWRLRRLQDR